MSADKDLRIQELELLLDQQYEAVDALLYKHPDKSKDRVKVADGRTVEEVLRTAMSARKRMRVEQLQCAPSFDTFLVDVMDALAYIKEHEADIYVRVLVDDKVKTYPLSGVTPVTWARYVHTWMREGRMPVRLVKKDEDSDGSS